MRQILCTITNIGRALFYPANFALRLISMIFLLNMFGFALIFPIELTVFILWHLIPVKLEQSLRQDLLFSAAFIGGSVGFTALITYFTHSIRTALHEILEHMHEVLHFKWIPELEIGKGLTTTWKQVSDATPKIGKVLSSSWILFFSVVMMTIVLGLVCLQVLANEEWQGLVQSRLRSIQKQQDESAQKFANWQIEVKGMHKYPRSTEKKASVYFLFYPPEGDLQTKIGICPDNRSLKNLSQFKAALAECSENGSQLKIEVRAFASIAPVKVGSNDDCSDLLNCEIANQRAEAVVGMLMGEQEDLNFKNCKTILRDNKYGRQPDKLCTRKTNDCNSLRLNNKYVDVIYRPWQSYNEMINARPADDGTLSSRRHKAEFLNRVVQIVVNNDVCWREEWLTMNH